MNRFLSRTTGVLVAGMLASGIAFAQGPRGGPGRGPDGRAGGTGLPLGALNLTEAQRQQIDDIRNRSQDERRQAQERVRQALDAQRKAVEALPANEAQIRSLAQAVGDAMADAAVHRSQVHAEVWNVLTPAQQEQAQKVQAQRQARMAQRRDEIRDRVDQRRERRR